MLRLDEDYHADTHRDFEAIKRPSGTTLPRVKFSEITVINMSMGKLTN